MSSKQFVENNFDLIRLFAATQVAVYHSVDLLAPQYLYATPMRLLELLPGVPIFFFLSGFLISKAYERNPEISVYAPNRALRIYPALLICLLINILLVAGTGYYERVGASLADIVTLYLAKATILQFYNPDFMREFGDGVLNGSLWTISVELQFYLLIPVLYRCLLTRSRARNNIILLVLILVSFGINRSLYALQPQFGDSNYWKLVRVSCFPWLCMFLIGVLAQQNFDRLRGLMSGRALLLIASCYVPVGYFLLESDVRFDNGMNPLIALPLFALTISVAYVRPSTANSVLHGTDLSYGIYIYHMVVVNMFLYYGLSGVSLAPLLAFFLSILLACGSWFLVEKPCLALKRRSMHLARQALSSMQARHPTVSKGILE